MNAVAARATRDKEQETRQNESLNLVTCRLSLTDPYEGQKDVEAKVIRAVGDPVKRFSEDALRLMRAVRFAAQLGFKIEEQTAKAITAASDSLHAVSAERIRDEFVKIIESENAEQGIRLLCDFGLLKNIVPELEEGIGIDQGKHHTFTVFEHSVKSLGFAAKFGYSTVVRLATLFHDIGKSRTRGGSGPDYTFYGHEMVGAKMTAKIMDRLRFPKDVTEKVVNLVRYHMFYYDVGEVTEKSVRRLLRKVGPENINDLLEVRMAERKGSGVPKAEPYRLRHLRYMIDKVSADPITVGMLAVRGEDVMKVLGISPGPKIGLILNALLEEVIDDPSKNSDKYLETRIKELGELPENELRKLAEAGKEKLEEERTGADQEIKKRYYVE
jgi:poly(A) polymerase/tRNA nucleotidyltransferase (CCA-adding enzyme)